MTRTRPGALSSGSWWVRAARALVTLCGGLVGHRAASWTSSRPAGHAATRADSAQPGGQPVTPSKEEPIDEATHPRGAVDTRRARMVGSADGPDLGCCLARPSTRQGTGPPIRRTNTTRTSRRVRSSWRRSTCSRSIPLAASACGFGTVRKGNPAAVSATATRSRSVPDITQSWPQPVTGSTTCGRWQARAAR